MISQPAIHVENLKKTFGSHVVLDGVSFEVQPGETFALLGRNGAGKTTIIQIMLGLLAADSGAVRIGTASPMADPIEVRRRVGYLAEDQTMYEWMTPVELCRFLEPFYPTWDTKSADDLLDRFEIPRQVKIGHLSKGQTVLLGLAVALAHRPRFAILDDPALGLDPIARKQFNRDLIEHLQSEGGTVLYSSHLLGEVEAVADSVAILDKGRIVRQAKTDALRADVKQVILPTEHLSALEAPEGLLDVEVQERRSRITFDGGREYIDRLERAGIEFELVDLTLDEIFEAFVVGRPHNWPGSAAAPRTAAAL